MTIYAFDIDGTICSNTYGNYELAEPFVNRIEVINNLYEKGHTIKMFTARGSTTNKDWYNFTKEQLKKWGLKFHTLIMGKPEADIFIDDKAINHNNWEWEKYENSNKSNFDVSQQHLKRASDAMLALSFNKRLIDKINILGFELSNALKNKGKIIFAGNGGSFADSQHLSAEFVAKLNVDRIPLASIALGTNASTISAIGNDYGYDYIFSRELEAIGNKNDFLIAITTSGSSKNIIELLKKSNSLGIRNALLTGPNIDSKAAKLSKFVINTPLSFTSTAEIQQMHITLGHLICDIAQKDFL